MPEKVELVKSNGENLSVELVSMFSVSNKEYILVTANEIDQNGLIKIHVAEILGNKIIKVVNEDEWIAVKNVMRSIISSSEGTFSYVSHKGPFNVEDDFSRIIAVQDSAKMQLVNDYNSKKHAIAENKSEVSVEKNDSVIPSIYPTDAANNNIIGEEVVPGIVDDAPVVSEDDLAKPIKIEAKPVVPEVPTTPVATNLPEVSTFTATETSNVEAESTATVSVNDNSAQESATSPVKEEPVVNEKNIFDGATISPAEVNTAISVSSNASTTNADSLKEELFNKIKIAVDEYLQKQTSNPVNNSEVESLKKELEEKNKKLNDIMGLLKLKD